jgi:hypothetical protein
VTTIEQAAARTGGGLQTQSRFMRASAIVRAFRTIFEDFRQSYVLRYSPNGVETRGWPRNFGVRAEGEGRHHPSPPGLLRGRRGQVDSAKNSQ